MKTYSALHFKRNSNKTERIYFLIIGDDIRVGVEFIIYLKEGKEKGIERKVRVIKAIFDSINSVWEVEAKYIE